MDDTNTPERDTTDIVREFVMRNRHLPHWEEPGAAYFVTFTLKMRHMCDLSSDELAPVIVGALRYFNGERYDLYEYVVMPDHVHAIMRVSLHGGTSESLDRIMHSIKSWTANRINERLGRTGTLWMDETYDHIIRDDEDYRNHAAYIWLNPFVAGLTDDPDMWPWFGDGQEDAHDDG